MLNLLINIAGIMLILYATYIIKKDMSKKQKKQTNLPEKPLRSKKTYAEYTEDSINEFDYLINKRTNNENAERSIKKTDISNVGKETALIVEDKENLPKNDGIKPFHRQIIELKSIGLTNEDIAKKLGKGIREIDIILKIYENN